MSILTCGRSLTAICAAIFSLQGCTSSLLTYWSDDPYVIGLRAFDTGAFEAARSLWKEGALYGDCDAQYRYGLLFILGAGVTKDYLEARSWLEKSANQGNWRAQGALMIMYLNIRGNNFGGPKKRFPVDCTDGCGVQKDYVTAYKWFLVASRLRALEELEQTKKVADGFRQELNSEQELKAEKLAREWKASPSQCKPRSFIM